MRPRRLERPTFGFGAEILIGRSCHFNQLTVVHSCLFRPVWTRLPPVLPPASPPKIPHRILGFAKAPFVTIRRYEGRNLKTSNGNIAAPAAVIGERKFNFELQKQRLGRVL
jgi:hypothetical protein